MESSSIFDLMFNPFLWQAVVFTLFGFLSGLSVHSLWGVPRRLIEATI